MVDEDASPGNRYPCSGSGRLKREDQKWSKSNKQHESENENAKTHLLQGLRELVLAVAAGPQRAEAGVHPEYAVLAVKRAELCDA